MITSIERNVAAEINMLKRLIAETQEQIEMMIDAEEYDNIDDVRQELAGYQEELSKYF